MDPRARSFSFGENRLGSTDFVSLRVSNKTISKAERDRLNYKPTPLKSRFLLSLFLVLCLLTALLEYARHVIPVTKDGSLIPQDLTVKASTTSSVDLSAASKRNAMISGRNTLNLTLTTISQGLSVAPTPSAWTFKNATSNETSPARNESIANSTASSPGNFSGSFNFTDLHQIPGNYPSLDDLMYGPIVYVTLRCNWEDGPPGQIPLWAGDTTPRDQCDCNSGAREWYSNDPLDCPYQFLNVYFDGGPSGIPWTPGSMDAAHAQTGWVPIIMDDGLNSGCEAPTRCSDVCGRYISSGWWPGTRQFPNGWPDRDVGTCEGAVWTTTFQVTQQLTTTSLVASTEVLTTETLTNKEGPVTVVHTTMIPASMEVLTTEILTNKEGPETIVHETLISGIMATITTNVTLAITATKMADRPVWTAVPRSTIGYSYEQSKGSDINSKGAMSPAPAVIVASTTSIVLKGSLTRPTSNPVVSTLGSMFPDQSSSNPVVSKTGSPALDQETTLTFRNSLGALTAILTEDLRILTNSNGLPTATQNMIFETISDFSGRPSAIYQEYLETFFDSNGVPTATIVVTMDVLTGSAALASAILVDLTATSTNSGALGPTDTSLNTSDWNWLPTLNTTHVALYVPVSHSNYFIVFFLPVMLAVLLSIAIQMLDKDLKLMLPFQALNRRNGAPASDSICLTPGGFTGPLHSIKLLYRSGEPLSLLSDLLVLLSSLLVSISSEAVGIKLYGKCQTFKFEGCSMYLDIFDGPSRATEALMTIMAVIVAIMGIFLRTTHSGVAISPWSIAGLCSLLTSQTAKFIRDIHPSNAEFPETLTSAQFVKALAGTRFSLQHYDGAHGQRKYGIVPQTCNKVVLLEPGGFKSNNRRLTRGSSNTQGRRKDAAWRQVVEDHGYSGLFLAILCGLLILILYYDTMQLDPSVDSFESFMDGQTFGIRFLFTGLAVLITFFWDDLFSRVSRMDPYKDLAHPRRRSNSSLSVSSATTVFLGLWRAIRRGNLFTSTVAFAGILSKFTPLLLSNIPYRITQTWITHLVCAWMTVGILVFMILVLLWSFFIKWPDMPVVPNTIAGSMCYLCDPAVLRDFEGMSMLGKKEWDERVKQIGMDYMFGERVGLSGQARTGIHIQRKGEKDVEEAVSPALDQMKGIARHTITERGKRPLDIVVAVGLHRRSTT